jgi:hypothetical protein
MTSAALLRLFFDDKRQLGGRTWTLERAKPDFSPLDFHQRFAGSISDDGATIDGEWQSSGDGRQWARDFRLTYSRIDAAR